MDQDQEGPFNVECRRHGLLPCANSYDAAVVLVGNHWLMLHEDGGPPAIEGQDWIRYPALFRCDTCGIPVEMPVWEHQAKNGPLGMEYTDLDGRWFLCGACHELFMARRLGPWVSYWWKTSQDISRYPTDTEQELLIRADIAQRFRTLMDELDDGQKFPAW